VIRLFSENLEASCNVGDQQSRSACALAATISGIAYSNSRPNVCHGVGSPLTLFWGAEHGQAVGITLTVFLRSQATGIRHKISPLWDALGVSDLDEATERLTQIMERCGLETRLSGLGLAEGDMDTLLEHVRWDRLTTLPVPLEKKSVEDMLRELL
jgi:alcohol dehydrogenase